MSIENQTPPIIIDCGGNNDSNRGDQAISVATCRIFDKYFPQFPHLYSSFYKREGGEFSGRCSDPKAIAPSIYEVRHERVVPWAAWAQITRLWRYYPNRKISRSMDHAAAFMAIAGDILVMDYGALALRVNSAPYYHAVKHQVPNFLWGSSIGPFPSGSAVERTMTKLLRSIDLILAREPKTVEYLTRLGITENVRKVADSAFTLPAVPLPVEGKNPIGAGAPFLPKEIDDALNAGAVGLDLSPYCSQVSKIRPRAWFEQNRELLIDLRKKIAEPIILIPHVMMPSWIFPECDDFIFQTKLHRSLPPEMRRDIFVYDPRNHVCTEMKWVISRLLAIASVRTHAAIAGYSSCIPTLAISYSRKSLGIYEDLFGRGDTRWIVSFRQLAGGRLSELVRGLLDHRDAICDRLQSVMPDYQRSAWKAGEYAAELLRCKGKID